MLFLQNKHSFVLSRSLSLGIIFTAIFLSLLHSTIGVANENKFPDARITLKETLIEVSFAPGAMALSLKRDSILKWIEDGAKAVESYYHGFPVDYLNISINTGGGSRITGSAYSGLKPMIILRLGENTTLKNLNKDWVLVHEMVHLAFPSVYKRHHWLEEGLATYVEPIARVRAGLMSEQDAWRWLITGTPKGQPKSGDKGLDFTPTWGRTYWGGALYCLQADYLIRKETKQRYGLEDALRAIAKAGGTMQREGVWSLTKALEIGDKATGTDVLMRLYMQMKDKPVKVDLTELWQRLGVKISGRRIVFNDNAPEVSMRRALIRAKQ